MNFATFFCAIDWAENHYEYTQGHHNWESFTNDKCLVYLRKKRENIYVHDWCILANRNGGVNKQRRRLSHEKQTASNIGNKQLK